VGGGNGYQPLATQVQSVTESRVRLSFETPGFSVFVVGDSVADTGDDGGDGGDSGVGSAILAGEESVTRTLYDGTARRVTVRFDRATTGTVAVESVGDLPAAAPDPDGRTLAAVDVTVPDEAASRPATVEIAVPSAAVEDAGVGPAALSVVAFDRGDDGLRRLDTDVVSADGGTVVLAAETPGFSTFAVVAPADRPARTATGTPASTRTAGGRSPTARDTATPSGAVTPTGTPAATATPEPTDGSGNGFGALAALVGLLASGVAMRRR
jgi:PGF-pre-PGF domain-containing protein